jgi:hypothetical protein
MKNFYSEFWFGLDPLKRGEMELKTVDGTVISLFLFVLSLPNLFFISTIAGDELAGLFR